MIKLVGLNINRGNMKIVNDTFAIDTIKNQKVLRSIVVDKRVNPIMIKNSLQIEDDIIKGTYIPISKSIKSMDTHDIKVDDDYDVTLVALCSDTPFKLERLSKNKFINCFSFVNFVHYNKLTKLYSAYIVLAPATSNKKNVTISISGRSFVIHDLLTPEFKGDIIKRSNKYKLTGCELPMLYLDDRRPYPSVVTTEESGIIDELFKRKCRIININDSSYETITRELLATLRKDSNVIIDNTLLNVKTFCTIANELPELIRLKVFDINSKGFMSLDTYKLNATR